MKDDTGFRYFKHELGISGNIPEGATLEHSNGSPFDYKNHTRLYISENVPFPDMDDPEYIQAGTRNQRTHRNSFHILPDASHGL